MDVNILGQIKSRFLGGIRAVGEMVYGATIYEMVRDLNKQRAMRERMFVLIVFGDMYGIPILPPYYTLRILPYILPTYRNWQRSLFIERDLVDLCDQEMT